MGLIPVPPRVPLAMCSAVTRIMVGALMLRFSRPGLAPKWRPPGLIAAGQAARRGRRRRRRGPHRGCGRSRGHRLSLRHAVVPLLIPGRAVLAELAIAGEQPVRVLGLRLGAVLVGPGVVVAALLGAEPAPVADEAVHGDFLIAHDATGFRPGRCAAMYFSRARSVIRCGRAPPAMSPARSQGPMPRTAHAWSRGTVRHRPGTARARYGVTTPPRPGRAPGS